MVRGGQEQDFDSIMTSLRRVAELHEESGLRRRPVEPVPVETRSDRRKKHKEALKKRLNEQHMGTCEILSIAFGLVLVVTAVMYHVLSWALNRRQFLEDRLLSG